MLQARKRTTIASGSEEIDLTPGYQYTLFIAPVATGDVTISFVGSDRSTTDYLVDSGIEAVTVDGKVAVITAVTSTILITLNSGATDVYVELNVIKAVSNAEGYV